MRPPRLFLFDIDGTLLRLDGAGRRALESAFAEVFGVGDPAALLAPIRFDGSTDRTILLEATARAGISDQRFASSRDAFEASYLVALDRLLRGEGPERILPGVLPLLESLSEGGDALGLLTGNGEAGARAKLAPFGLNRFFPAGAFGSDHEDRVVLARLARQRLERHAGVAFPGERVFVVGDSVMDVRAGKAHGFRTVAVLTGWTSRDRLAAEAPDHLLEDLRGLPPLLGGGIA